MKKNQCFRYLYDNHLEDADWFLKADDDTYTVMENLLYMLQPYNHSQPIYFGCKFKPYVKQERSIIDLDKRGGGVTLLRATSEL